MSVEVHSPTECRPARPYRRSNGVSSGVYGVAFIGALVYYLQHAATFWEGALGVFKALFWPAFLIYKVLEFLKA